MSKRKMVAKALVVLAALFLMSAPNAFAQECCMGNFDCDLDVDGSDAFMFKQNFGRRDCPGLPECECPAPIVIPCDPPAPVPKTGQTTTYNMADDGLLEKGVAWPNPRFTDNGDGTVTDNLTGLIWLEYANCFGLRSWTEAIFDSFGLTSGNCGLTDGSSMGDWRLPNLFELESLRDMAYYSPALPNTAGTGQWSAGDPFDTVQSAYWSSTTYAFDIDYAWYVMISGGDLSYKLKTSDYYVWPVRGGND
jgi:hypothetical protein